MIIDFNAYVGSCPGGFGDWGITDIKRSMDDAGIDIAVVSRIGASFEEACEDPGDDRIVLFASVGPDDPVEKIPESVKGICLYTGYDSWDLDGDKFGELLLKARKQKWIVHFNTQFLDPRVLDQQYPVEDQLASFDKVAEKWSDIRFVISGTRVFDVESSKALFGKDNVWTDISHVQHPLNSLPRLLKAIPDTKVLFATNAPFFYPYVNVFRVNNSPISDKSKSRIFEENAKALLGM